MPEHGTVGVAVEEGNSAQSSALLLGCWATGLAVRQAFSHHVLSRC